MAKVPQGSRTAGAPQLKPEHTGGAELVVVTIATVTLKKSQFRDVEQPVLTFEEFPENELRLGKRAADRVCKGLGTDEMDDWVGERIPLLKAREDVGNKSYIVYQPAPEEEWAALFKRDKSARKGKK